MFMGKGVALLFVLIVIAAAMMPARKYLPLFGLGAIGFGVYMLGSSTATGVVCIAVGTLCIVQGGRLHVLDARQEEEDARAAQEYAEKQNRLRF